MGRKHQNGGVVGAPRIYYDTGNMTGVHDMQTVYDSFSASPSNREGFNQGTGYYIPPPVIDETYTLKTGSTPSGLQIQSGSGLATGWSTFYGFQTGGNASGFSTPLQRTATLSGNSDWLFQVSTRCYNSCWDPALQFWPASNGRSAPSWNWGTTNSTCVSFQCNCKSYTMLNTPQGGANSGSIGGSNSGEYFTHHLWWVPSTSTVYGKITYGEQDYTIAGSNAATATSRSFSIYNGTDCYFGLASDYDGVGVSSTSTNFNYLRIREFQDGYATNTSGIPTW